MAGMGLGLRGFGNHMEGMTPASHSSRSQKLWDWGLYMNILWGLWKPLSWASIY